MSALPSNGASRSTPVSLVESMFDEHFEATTTCCAGADARPVSTLATRLHEVSHPSPVFALAPQQAGHPNLHTGHSPGLPSSWPSRRGCRRLASPRCRGRLSRPGQAEWHVQYVAGDCRPAPIDTSLGGLAATGLPPCHGRPRCRSQPPNVNGYVVRSLWMMTRPTPPPI